MGRAIGIDLGTTYSCVAVYQNGTVNVINNSKGNRTTPSVVAFKVEANGSLTEYVGTNSRDADVPDENIISDAKRFIGQQYGSKSVQRDKKYYPFEIEEDCKRRLVFSVGHKNNQYNFTPEQISAKILACLKGDAERYLNEKVTHAVITVPAYFNDSQRLATKKAAKLAGLEVLGIMNEPTAALLAHSRHLEKEKIVFIFDYGGGTFDVTLARVQNNEVEILVKMGDAHLGGSDIDQAVMNHIVDLFKTTHNMDLLVEPRDRRRLRMWSEELKKKLSGSKRTIVEVGSASTQTNNVMSIKVTRSELEQLSSDQFALIKHYLRETMKQANMNPTDVDEVVLVGGSSRIPYISTMIRDYFQQEPRRGVHEDEAVAIGAAYRAAMLFGNASELRHLCLLDINPLSIGTSGFDGFFHPIIPRGTRYPTEVEHPVVTTLDYQTSLLFEVYEGERPEAKKNNHLGSIHFDKIIPDLAGRQSVQLVWKLDESGLLSVEIVKNRTRKTNDINRDTVPYDRADVEDFLEAAKKSEIEDRYFVDWRNARIDVKSRVEQLRDDVFQRRIPNREAKIRKMGEFLNWLNTLPRVDPQEFERRYNELHEYVTA